MGIGRATADIFTREGAKVIFWSIMRVSPATNHC